MAPAGASSPPAPQQELGGASLQKLLLLSVFESLNSCSPLPSIPSLAFLSSSGSFSPQASKICRGCSTAPFDRLSARPLRPKAIPEDQAREQQAQGVGWRGDGEEGTGSPWPWGKRDGGAPGHHPSHPPRLPRGQTRHPPALFCSLFQPSRSRFGHSSERVCFW